MNCVLLGKKMMGAVFLLGVSVLGGCSYTYKAVKPHPNVMVPQGLTFALQMSAAVPDVVELAEANAKITEFRTSISNGFYAALGAQATSTPQENTVVLVIDEVFIRREQLGYMGVLVAQFKGHWQFPNGEVLIRFAGKAAPDNVLSSGERHIEDLLENTMETILSNFTEKWQELAVEVREPRASSGGGEQQGEPSGAPASPNRGGIQRSRSTP